MRALVSRGYGPMVQYGDAGVVASL